MELLGQAFPHAEKRNGAPMSWEQIRGWYDFEAIYAEAIAAASDTDTLVEVGVAYGKSLAHLARMAIDSSKACRIIGVDPWESVWGYWDDLSILVDKEGGAREAFEAEMARYAPEERKRVQIYQQTSTDAAARVAKWGKDIDAPPGPPLSFVWIDAVHDKPHVLEDIAAWMPLVRPGGVIGGHDHTPSFPGVEEAVREAFPGGYEIRGSSWIYRLPK